MSNTDISTSLPSQCLTVCLPQLDAEYRRINVDKATGMKYEDWEHLLCRLHGLENVPFFVTYTDPQHGDLLPINNDENLAHALHAAKPLLRVFIQRKGTHTFEHLFYILHTPHPHL